MSQPDPPKEKQHGRWVIGSALIVIGLLILIPTGLCTAIFLPAWIEGRRDFISIRGSDFFLLAGIAGIGIALVFTGFKMGRGN